jgi:DNA-binding transcriptional LysR family regulator
VNTLLDIRQLNNFVALAEERSFTKAAKRVHLSQSAISHSLKNLEDEIGGKLIKRAGHTMLLTQHGEVFYREAKEIIARIAGLREHITNLNDWGRGRIRIGAGSTACQYFIPSVLRELRETFPRCELHIQSSDTTQSLDALRRGDIDVALIVKGSDLDRIAYTSLFSDTLMAAYNPGHHWSEKTTISAKDFEEVTVLQYGEGTVTHTLLKEYFDEHEVDIRQSVELNSMDALREMARMGQGVALLPEWILARSETTGITARPMPHQGVKRDWGFATLAGKSLSLLEATFQGLCEEHALSFEARYSLSYPLKEVAS